jgi:hypothetical protein
VIQTVYLVQNILTLSLFVAGLKKNSIGCIYYANLLIVVKLYTRLYIYKEIKGSEHTRDWLYQHSANMTAGSVYLVLFVSNFETDYARLLAFIAVLCFGAAGN